jgi:flagellar basal-body rod protein FlgB
MEPVFLTKLVSHNNDWLSVRQATIAENIANANTPGFGARDVEPFVSVISKTQLAMTATHGSHLGQTMEAAKASDGKGRQLERHPFRQLREPRAGADESR